MSNRGFHVLLDRVFHVLCVFLSSFSFDDVIHLIWILLGRVTVTRFWTCRGKRAISRWRDYLKYFLSVKLTMKFVHCSCAEQVSWWRGLMGQGIGVSGRGSGDVSVFTQTPGYNTQQDTTKHSYRTRPEGDVGQLTGWSTNRRPSALGSTSGNSFIMLAFRSWIRIDSEWLAWVDCRRRPMGEID